MKVVSKDFATAIKRVDVTKEDAILSVSSEKGMCTLSSVNTKMGVLVQTRIDAEDIDEDKEFYIPKGVSDSIVSLSAFGNEFNISELKGKIKVSAGKKAKINIGLLEKKPAEYKQTDSIVGYSVSGREISKAINDAAENASKMLALVFGPDNTISCFGVSGPVLSRDKLSYLESRKLKNADGDSTKISMDDFDSKYVSVDEQGCVVVAIKAEVWKSIAGVFLDEWCTVNITNEQLKFVWNSQIITIPLTENVTSKNISEMFDKIYGGGDDKVVTEIKFSDLSSVVNLVSTTSDEILLELNDDKLAVSSISGFANVNIKKVESQFKGNFDARLIKKKLVDFKNCENIELQFLNELVIAMKASIKYEYSWNDEDITQEVESIAIILGIKK